MSERLERFQREARKSLAALNHPNIAAIYGLEDSGDTHALVMELAEGPDARRPHPPSGRFLLRMWCSLRDKYATHWNTQTNAASSIATSSPPT